MGKFDLCEGGVPFCRFFLALPWYVLMFVWARIVDAQGPSKGKLRASAQRKQSWVPYEGKGAAAPTYTTKFEDWIPLSEMLHLVRCAKTLLFTGTYAHEVRFTEKV